MSIHSRSDMCHQLESILGWDTIGNQTYIRVAWVNLPGRTSWEDFSVATRHPKMLKSYLRKLYKQAPHMYRAFTYVEPTVAHFYKPAEYHDSQETFRVGSPQKLASPIASEQWNTPKHQLIWDSNETKVEGGESQSFSS